MTMTNAYELKIPTFVGPVEKLLELIQEKKLDITAISLSEVTADFLNYLSTLGKVPPGVLADFIVVAARLMLIKSKALLPELPLSEEEEADIKDLESRLLLYREFKEAGRELGGLWKKHRVQYGRELFSAYQVSFFYPSPGLTTDAMSASLQSLLMALQAIQMREKNIARSAIISVEQKMGELLNHIGGASKSQFSDLAKTKEEMVVLFLAVLHLLKERLIEIEQQENFSHIIIKPPRAQ